MSFNSSTQIPVDLHEQLLNVPSAEKEKCTNFFLERFFVGSSLFISHLMHNSDLFEKHLAHHEGIKELCPILGNFLLGTESEVREAFKIHGYLS